MIEQEAIWIPGAIRNTLYFSHFCPGRENCESRYHDADSMDLGRS